MEYFFEAPGLFHRLIFSSAHCLIATLPAPGVVVESPDGGRREPTDLQRMTRPTQGGAPKKRIYYARITN